MNCPACHVSLEEYRYRGMKVLRCSRCGGVWFGAGQLGECISLRMVNRPDLPDANLTLHRDVVTVDRMVEP